MIRQFPLSIPLLLVTISLFLFSACNNKTQPIEEIDESTTTGYQLAPEFSLADASGSAISLAELLSQSRRIVLVFYRGHF